LWTRNLRPLLADIDAVRLVADRDRAVADFCDRDPEAAMLRA
jgi:hypothetical protein